MVAESDGRFATRVFLAVRYFTSLPSLHIAALRALTVYRIGARRGGTDGGFTRVVVSSEAAQSGVSLRLGAYSVVPRHCRVLPQNAKAKKTSRVRAAHSDSVSDSRGLSLSLVKALDPLLGTGGFSGLNRGSEKKERLGRRYPDGLGQSRPGTLNTLGV